jgi:hypothetical protein
MADSNTLLLLEVDGNRRFFNSALILNCKMDVLVVTSGKNKKGFTVKGEGVV